MASTKKILIVDDEPDILEILSYNFKKKHFDVSIAKNGIEGLAMAKRDTPDIIISDILMPEMNGIEMCMEIRKKPEMKQTPLLFFSAALDYHQFTNVKYSGNDHYLSKPIRFDYLLSIVNGLI